MYVLLFAQKYQKAHKGLLAAARSHLGSNSPPDCYSLPRCRFATLLNPLCSGSDKSQVSSAYGSKTSTTRPSCSNRSQQNTLVLSQARHAAIATRYTRKTATFVCASTCAGGVHTGDGSPPLVVRVRGIRNPRNFCFFWLQKKG